MKIQVSRASQSFLSEEPPVVGAVKQQYTYIDVRCVKSPEDICHKPTRDNWYKIGQNHRQYDEYSIARDIPNGISAWFLEIDSVESFVKEYGCCVVNLTENGWLSLQIYDDYLE